MTTSSNGQSIRGFPPIVNPCARVLVLGSVPSIASLEKHQYYGKPQNAFWKIMGELFGASPHLPYGERTAILAAAGVAVWDVVATCVRPGSLDSSINMRSVEVNEFETFLSDYPAINSVYFNGRKAAEIYMRHVAPVVAVRWPAIHYETLPSTSPAMASLNFAAKLQQWRVVANAAAE